MFSSVIAHGAAQHHATVTSPRCRPRSEEHKRDSTRRTAISGSGTHHGRAYQAARRSKQAPGATASEATRASPRVTPSLSWSARCASPSLLSASPRLRTTSAGCGSSSRRPACLLRLAVEAGLTRLWLLKLVLSAALRSATKGGRGGPAEQFETETETDACVRTHTHHTQKAGREP